MLTSAFFLLFHHIILKTPIWFVAPAAIIFGIITGLALVWSYKVYFDEFNWINTFKLHLIYLFSILVLLMITLNVFEPMFTFEEANDPNNTDRLLSAAFSIVIPFAIFYGIVQGLVYKRSRNTVLASLTTNFVILTGIGYNFPLFVLVEFNPGSSILVSELKILVLLLVLIGVFMSFIHLLNRLGRREKLAHL